MTLIILVQDIEINEPDQPSFKNRPKKLYSYIKSQKNENTGIAPLRSEGTQIFLELEVIAL
jgi:hypothetical protein